MKKFRVKVIQLKTYEMFFDDVEASTEDEAYEKVQYHIDQLKSMGLDSYIQRKMHQIDCDMHVSRDNT